MKTHVRLFLVDDHPVVLAGLRTIEELAPEIRIVGEARTADAALTGIAEVRPDAVLLDIRIGEQSGVEVCRQLKLNWPELRILFLTSYADDQLVLSAMEAGADGYLLKENDTIRLIEAIHEVLRGEVVFDARAIRRLGEKTGSPSAVHQERALSSLSPQELKLLGEVAKGKTDKEVALALGLTSKTARNYLDRVFTKLGVHTRTEAATLYVRCRGLAP